MSTTTNFNQAYTQSACFGSDNSACGSDADINVNSCNNNPNISANGFFPNGFNNTPCPNTNDLSYHNKSESQNPPGVCSSIANDGEFGGTTANCPCGWYPCCSYDDPLSARSGFLCSLPDQSQCPIINNIEPVGASLQGVTCSGGTSNNVCPAYNVGQPADINCIYDQTDFTTLADAQAWEASFPDDTTNINDKILPSVCGKTASSVEDGYQQYCPTDPNTGATMTDCSRILLVDDPQGYGSTCSQWCAEFPSQCNNAENKYCGGNNTPDCGCINSINDPTFIALDATNSLNPIPETCWWLPCNVIAETTYLIPTTISDQPCPSEVTVCQSVIAAINNTSSTINIGNNQLPTNCTSTPTSGGSLDKKIVLALGIIAVIVIVIVIIVVIFFFFK